jgi:hypothetical protein
VENPEVPYRDQQSVTIEGWSMRFINHSADTVRGGYYDFEFRARRCAEPVAALGQRIATFVQQAIPTDWHIYRVTIDPDEDGPDGEPTYDVAIHAGCFFGRPKPRGWSFDANH